MASDLLTLEGLLNEFFRDHTSNKRKHEIEEMLKHFGEQRDVWQQCLFYFLHSQNDYVSMFCLTTMQNFINKQWIGLPEVEKAEIQSTFYNYLLNNHRSIPYFIRNKLIKLIVDCAKYSSVESCSEIFVNVQTLSRNSETIYLCLLFIQTISEEMVVSYDGLSYSHRSALHNLLTQEMTGILNLLAGFIEDIIRKHKGDVVTATPPPSPNHIENSSSDSSLSHTIPFPTGTLFIQRLEEGKEKVKSNFSLSSLDFESEMIACQTLRCLAHLFSWIPLSSYISLSLINNIFLLVTSDLQFEKEQEKTNHLDSSQSYGADNVSIEKLSVLALSAINEIINRNYMPQHFQNYLLLLFCNAYELLQQIIQRAETLHSNNLEHIDSEFLDKFAEFLHLFVSIHLCRFESNPNFQLCEFFHLLLHFTFLQPSVETYFNCLEIWNIFLEYLISKSLEYQQLIKKYEDVLLSLAQGIINKIQLRHNQVELEDLEHEVSCNVVDDTDYSANPSIEYSERHAFLIHNIELLAKIADLLPENIFNMVDEPFVATSKVYLSLNSSLISQGSEEPKKLRLTSEHECPKLHCVLQDLACFLLTVGRLSSLFLGELLLKRSSIALHIIERLIEISNFGTELKLYAIETPVEVISTDFIEVQSQALSSLQAWVHWLSQLYGQQFVQVFPGGSQRHIYQETCHSINKQMLLAGLSVIQPQVPNLIFISGLRLLLSLSVLVHSPVALELKQMLNLFSTAHTISADIKVQKLLYRALINFLLLPWPSFIDDQKLGERKSLLTSFVLAFTSELNALNVQELIDNEKLRTEMSAKICDILSLVRIQIDELSGADKTSKELFFNNIENIIHKVKLLFPVYISFSSVTNEILSFVVSVVQVLRVQLGPSKVESLLQAFLDVFSSTQLHLHLAADHPDRQTAVYLIEKFLKLLEIVVIEPGQSFKRFLPDVLTICLDHIYPMVIADVSSEVKLPLFSLFRAFLEYNWRYFFRSAVQSSIDTVSCDSIENEYCFVQIMQAFGQSLMQSDINIFKQNLETLECLNSKYKLYHKSFFRNMMLGHFITVLFQVLIHHSQDLLQEEIINCIYNMVAVDFITFFDAFLPHFLKNVGDLSDSQQNMLKNNFKNETDFPSFVQNVRRFSNDVKFCRLCNTSWSPTTIKL